MLKKLFLSVVVVFVLLSSCFVVVSADATMWSRTFGETTDEKGYCVVETLDGGFAMVGTADHVDGDDDLWLIRTDEFGNVEWNRTYQASFVVNEFSLIATSDGGYAIASHKEVSYPESSTNLAYDFWLIKTDAYGNVEWNKTYGGPELDMVQSMVEASDGGFVLVGYTRSFGEGEIDCWVVKTDENGIEEWNRTYGGTDFDWFYSVITTSDEGYLMGGFTRSFGFEDDHLWLIKIDVNGSVEWDKFCGGTGVTGGNLGRTCSLVKTSDGGYGFAYPGGGDFLLVKTDASGNVEWNQRYGGTETEWVRSMVAAPDGGCVLAGFTNSFGAGSHDCWVVKTDDLGDMDWDHTYGGTGYDVAESIVAVSDGGYAICGRLSEDLWLVKTDADGNMVWNQTYSGVKVDVAYSVIETSDGGFAVAGVTAYRGAEQGECLVVKTNNFGDTEWTFPAFTSGTGYEIIETSGGDYAVAGYTGSLSGNADFWFWWFEKPADLSWTLGETYGGTEADVAYSLVEASDGGFVLAGFTESFGAGGADFWLIKVNATIATCYLKWNQTYGGTGDERAHCVVKTSDGGYAIAGETSSFGSGGKDFWLVKTDGSGNIEWNQTYGGTANETAYSLVETSDGGYALAGFTETFGSGGADFWLVKTNSTGHMEWNKTYGGIETDVARSVVEAYGGYTLVGETQSLGAGSTDFWLVRTDSYGNEEWNQTHGGEGKDVAYSLIETSDGGYATTGYTGSFGDCYCDMWLIKTDENGIIPEYSSWIITSLLFTAMLVIVITKRRQPPTSE